jgi:MFS family permease
LGALLAAVGIRAAPVRGSRAAAGPEPPSRLLSDPTVRRTLLGVVATTAAVGVLAGFLPGAVEARGGAAATTGLLFTVYATVAAALMLSPAAGRVDREGPRRTVAAGLVVLAAALGLLSIDLGLVWTVVGAGVFGLGYGLIFPAASGAVALASPPARRGWAFGWFNVAFSLGIAVGPPVIGAITEQLPAADPFLLAGAVCAAAAVTVGRLR